MAKEAVAQRGISIGLACLAFTISPSCYRYQAKLDAENARIADWLVRLTDNNRNWASIWRAQSRVLERELEIILENISKLDY